jgi:hypothetical protein
MTSASNISASHTASEIIQLAKHIRRMGVYLYSCDDSMGKGNLCPNFSKIGIPKGVLIDVWGYK